MRFNEPIKCFEVSRHYTHYRLEFVQLVFPLFEGTPDSISISNATPASRLNSLGVLVKLMK